MNIIIQTFCKLFLTLILLMIEVWLQLKFICRCSQMLYLLGYFVLEGMSIRTFLSFFYQLNRSLENCNIIYLHQVNCETIYFEFEEQIFVNNLLLYPLYHFIHFYS
ncbi:hypothetical protein J437_LFUL012035 [Ladona fulva]|uniref:Transmembrane protein n=1 Tax=Ladona fulva TaxID=123851 RepID=A0A8K0P303_LADFU|nr:hypothetical protein J437_LFUL012035 [Ladona fulva]